MMRRMRYWTKEEDALLKKLWSETPKAQLEKIFEDRTWEALCGRASTMGFARTTNGMLRRKQSLGRINTEELDKTLKYLKLSKKEQETDTTYTETTQSNTQILWSQEEIDVLKKVFLHRDVLNEDLEKIFKDRTLSAIRNKASSIGLKKPDYRKEGRIDFEYLKKLYEVIEG